jgi:hypothetical protein
MRPNAQQLALRDPALAALMGVIGTGANSFGAESDFGAEYVDDMGEDDYGAEFGDDDDYGAEFGAAAKGAIKVPRPASQAQLVSLWKNVHAKKAVQSRREMLLEPNKGSSIKIEKYAFTVSQAITLGTAVAFTTLTGQPDTSIRPQRLTCNAPTPMFAFLQEIKVANVSVSVGSGLEDAYNYNANGVGQHLDMPTLSPANRMTILGSYTGYVPPGFVGGSAVFFSATVKGPASIVA